MAYRPERRVGAVSWAGVIFLAVFIVVAVTLGAFAAQRFVHWIGYPPPPAPFL